MNPEKSTKDFDIFELEPKAEIGEGLDLEADEEFADGQTTMGVRSLLNAYFGGMSTIEENLRSLMKLEDFAEKVVENDASN